MVLQELLLKIHSKSHLLWLTEAPAIPISTETLMSLEESHSLLTEANTVTEEPILLKNLKSIQLIMLKK
jgi:hypothetical protein